MFSFQNIRSRAHVGLNKLTRRIFQFLSHQISNHECCSVLSGKSLSFLANGYIEICHLSAWLKLIPAAERAALIDARSFGENVALKSFEYHFISFRNHESKWFYLSESRELFMNLSFYFFIKKLRPMSPPPDIDEAMKRIHGSTVNHQKCELALEFLSTGLGWRRGAVRDKLLFSKCPYQATAELPGF